jgi:hypothetical protein
MDWNVFVSYSHVDDKPFSNNNLGWVARFSKDLKVAIGQQVLNREVSVWSDRGMDGNEYFADSIDQATANSTIFLPIVSPAYIVDKNGWLKKEREQFIRAAAGTGGLRIGNRSRICPILRRVVKFDELPIELKALNLKHRFYNDEGRTLRHTEYEDAVDAVAETIRKMFGDLHNTLADLHKLSAADPSRQRSSKDVYLANATPDLDYERAQIKTELQRDGYTVHLTPTLSSDPAAMHKTIQEQMSQCSLSIHLIGGNLENVPDLLRSAIDGEYRSARSEYSKGLAQIIWTPNHISLDTLLQNSHDSVRTFYLELKEAEGLEYSRQTFQALLSFIHDKLKNIQRSESVPMVDGNDLPPGIMRKAYYVCDLPDRELLKAVEEKFRARNWWVEFPPKTSDEAKFRKLHEMHLRDCQAYIIYYGDTEPTWVDMQRVDYRMANWPYKCRPAPLYSKWIYKGPLENPDKQEYGPKEDYRLDGDFEHPFTDEFIERVITTRSDSQTKSSTTA